MTLSRPVRVGSYDLLQDFENTKASVRVFRIRAEEHAVHRHMHAKSTQIYIALQGRALIEIDGVFTPLEPYGCISVPIGAYHSAQPAGDEEVVLMNISTPPLGPDDQAPAGPPPSRNDYTLPTDGGDIDD